jgi:hypothetical protein
VAAVSTNYKRLFLRGLRWDADKGPLLDVLKAVSRARLKDTQGGKVLTATTGNGQSATYTLPFNGAGASPQDIAELCEEMLTRYEAAVAEVSDSLTEDIAANNDLIFNEMMALLQPVHEVAADFSQVGCYA